ncbi:MAG: DNA glycosylase AlkZ-like family protein [Vicinamibacterales bacterium]
MPITSSDLRRSAITRSLFAPTSLRRALRRLGFVQADPIRSPARAQDLILRHRVKGYKAGDLERRYTQLGVQEDVFINYGFVPSEIQALMHPRGGMPAWPADRTQRARDLLAFVRERGPVHPREAERYFAHGRVTNYWGGTSNATTHLLEDLHYRGLLRVSGREHGTRLYTAHDHTAAPQEPSALAEPIDALVDLVVRIYAPVPAISLGMLVSRLRYAAPQWRGTLRDALRRAMQRLSRARVDGLDWYWPGDERLRRHEPPEMVRLLAPFDPVVWDRQRFALLWGWAYRFEAYTPAAKRRRGYYALPLLWGDRVIGWGNISVTHGALTADLGYVDAAPRGRVFTRELEAELNRMRNFLDLESRS